MASRQPRPNGFTLVELLVVIGIIALLISILIPSLNKARQQAQMISCASNLKQLYTATLLYATDNKDWMMPAVGGSGNEQRNRWWGVEILGPTMGLKWKGDPSPTATAPLEVRQRIFKIITCPANDRTDKNFDTTNKYYTGSYTYNASMGNYDAYANPTDASKAYGFFKKRARLPQNVVLAADVESVAVKSDDTFGTLEDLVSKVTAPSVTPRMGNCHFHKGNVLFTDGVVRLLQGYDLNRLATITTADLDSATDNYSQIKRFMVKERDGSSPPKIFWNKATPLPF